MNDNINNKPDITQFAEIIRGKFEELGIRANIYKEEHDSHRCIGVSFPSDASTLPVIDLTGLYCMVYTTCEISEEGAVNEALNIYKTSYKALVEENSMSYRLLQLKRDAENRRDLSFASLKELSSYGLKVDAKNYETVYSGIIPEIKEDMILLEDLFEKFNINHPSDFTGHSMSVSDIVILHLNGKDTAYYCDSFGFEKLTDFFSGKEAA